MPSVSDVTRLRIMSNRQVYRFCIRNSIGEHSSVWRVWAVGNDVYAGHRGITQSYKASFHSDGECHSGLSSDIRKTLIDNPKWKGKSRHYDQWHVKNVLGKGESLDLVELIFPNSQLDDFDIESTPAVNWLECSKGNCVSIAIFKANFEDGKIVTSNERDFKHLFTMSLKNGNKIIILYRLIDEKEQYLNFIKNHMTSTLSNLDEDVHSLDEKTYKCGSFNNTDPKIRAMLWHRKEDGHRVWIECSVWKNIIKQPLTQGST